MLKKFFVLGMHTCHWHRMSLDALFVTTEPNHDRLHEIILSTINVLLFRQRYYKCSAVIYFAFKPNFATMIFYNLPADGEA